MLRRALPSTAAALLLLMVMAGAYVPAAHALTVQADVSITTSNGSTVCSSSLGGTWSGDTCTMHNALTLGGALDIGAGVTVVGRSGSEGLYGIDSAGTINNYGTITSSGIGALVNDAGTVNNYGTITAIGAHDAIGQFGVANSGTINNLGTINASGYEGIDNYGGTINNAGTINASASGFDGIYNYNSGTINNAGTINASGPTVIDTSAGTINLYCAGTLPGVNANNTYSCYTTTFSQTGIPAGVAWVVTTSWGPFVLPVSYTATGGSFAIQAVGSLNYSYGTPVKSSGATYGCTSGCLGTPTVSGAVAFSAGYVTMAVTATAVSCSPSSVFVVSSTTCTATVTGSSPTGTVTFSTSAGATSQFNSTTCTLSSGACSVTYSPLTATSPVTITATYGGDPSNLNGSGTYSLSVSTPPPRQPPIPPAAAPGVLDFVTYGNISLTAYKVGMLGAGQVIYNIPSLNQTLLDQELAQGDFTLFPNAVTTCSTTVQGQSLVRVSGFSDVSWGWAFTNSTEFVFGGWESFLTGAAGWPAEPACSG